MPLRLGNGQEEGTGSAARIAGINAGNLQITQLAGTGSVLAGGNAEILATFRNTSAERHEALSVNFYFVLENSTLVSAASGCRQGSVGTQKVLNCPLGDFAAGEVKTVRYTIATTPASRPRVISTAVVGELRHDAVLNVVEADSDLTATWTGFGILQQSTDLTSWTDVPGASSPHVEPVGAGKKFFRLRL